MQHELKKSFELPQKKLSKTKGISNTVLASFLHFREQNNVSKMNSPLDQKAKDSLKTMTRPENLKQKTGSDLVEAKYTQQPFHK